MTRPRIPLPGRRWRGPLALVALAVSSVAFGGLALPLLASDASPAALTAKPAKTVHLVRAHDGRLCPKRQTGVRAQPLLRAADR